MENGGTVNWLTPSLVDINEVQKLIVEDRRLKSQKVLTGYFNDVVEQTAGPIEDSADPQKDGDELTLVDPLYGGLEDSRDPTGDGSELEPVDPLWGGLKDISVEQREHNTIFGLNIVYEAFK